MSSAAQHALGGDASAAQAPAEPEPGTLAAHQALTVTAAPQGEGPGPGAQQEGPPQGEGDAPAAELDPAEALQLEISMAFKELGSIQLTQPTEEELAQAELEQALIMHQMAEGQKQHAATAPHGRAGASADPQAGTAGGSGQPLAGGLASMMSHHSDASGALLKGILSMPVHDEDEVQVETEVQKYQARIKRSVQRDIKKMLASTKAYVKHYSPPPVISKEQLSTLAAPKGLLHPDTQLALEAGTDYGEYARRKAEQLRQARLRAEAEQAEHGKQADVLRQQLHNYQGWKAQRESLKKEILSSEARAQAEHGRRVAKYVAERAQHELKHYKAQQDAARGRAAQVHQEKLAANFH